MDVASYLAIISVVLVWLGAAVFNRRHHEQGSRRLQ